MGLVGNVSDCSTLLRKTPPGDCTVLKLNLFTRRDWYFTGKSCMGMLLGQVNVQSSIEKAWPDHRHRDSF